MGKLKIEKNNKFLLGLYIYIISLVTLIAVALAVFWQFMAAYEASLPANTAREYVTSLTDADWRRMIGESLDSLAEQPSQKYQTREETVASIFGEGLTEPVSFLKKSDEATAERPVYLIMSGSRKLAALYLKAGGKGNFNFDMWEVDKCVLLDGGFSLKPSSVTVTAPVGSSLTYLGKPIDGDRQPDTVPAPASSPYEKAENAPRSEVYLLSGIFGDVSGKIKCEYNGAVLTASANGNSALDFPYPDTDVKSYTVTLPKDAVLSVNGIAVSEADRTKYLTAEAPLKGGEFEVSAESLPYTATYTLGGFYGEPEFTATLGGASLKFTSDGSAYSASYPTELLNAVSIYAPAGSTVTLNGIALTSDHIFSSDAAAGLNDFAGYLSTVPSVDCYRIVGLFYAPSVTVENAGAPLEVIFNENGRELTYEAAFAPSEETQAQFSETALSFIKAYIYYTAKGYENLDANLDQVLSYMIWGTDSYSRVYNSRYGIEWMSPYYTIDYQYLEAEDFVRYSEDCFTCRVKYKVHLEMWQVTNDYEDVISLVFIKTASGMKVAEMMTGGEV